MRTFRIEHQGRGVFFFFNHSNIIEDNLCSAWRFHCKCPLPKFSVITPLLQWSSSQESRMAKHGSLLRVLDPGHRQLCCDPRVGLSCLGNKRWTNYVQDPRQTSRCSNEQDPWEIGHWVTSCAGCKIVVLVSLWLVYTQHCFQMISYPYISESTLSLPKFLPLPIF